MEESLCLTTLDTRVNLITISREGIWVHGWIFHVETGRIEEVTLENKMPKEL